MINFLWLNHACVIVEKNQTRIITDPWFGFPFHFATFHSTSANFFDLNEVTSSVSAIHISHHHQDHFCGKSLSYFKKDIPIFISRYLNKNFYLEIKKLGFINIIELENMSSEGFLFQDFRIFSIQAKNNQFTLDSFLILEEVVLNESESDVVYSGSGSGRAESIERFLTEGSVENKTRKSKTDCESVILLNDSRVSEEQIQWIKKRFQNIKFLFMSFTDIYLFPTCYKLLKPIKQNNSQRSTHNDNPISDKIIDQKFEILNQRLDKMKSYLFGLCRDWQPEKGFLYANNLIFKNEINQIHNRIFKGFDSIINFLKNSDLVTEFPQIDPMPPLISSSSSSSYSSLSSSEVLKNLFENAKKKEVLAKKEEASVLKNNDNTLFSHGSDESNQHMEPIDAKKKEWEQFYHQISEVENLKMRIREIFRTNLAFYNRSWKVRVRTFPRLEKKIKNVQFDPRNGTEDEIVLFNFVFFVGPEDQKSFTNLGKSGDQGDLLVSEHDSLEFDLDIQYSEEVLFKFGQKMMNWSQIHFTYQFECKIVQSEGIFPQIHTWNESK